MENNPQKTVVILQESIIGSLIKDTGTFALFAGLLYFNHRFIGGGVLVDIFFIVFGLFWASLRTNSQVFSGLSADAVKWLQNKDMSILKSGHLTKWFIPEEVERIQALIAEAREEQIMQDELSLMDTELPEEEIIQWRLDRLTQLKENK